MKKTLMNLFSALALSTLVACGGEADASASAVGTYKIDTAALVETMLAAMPAEAKADEAAAKKMAEGMAGGFDISIELKEDGTCSNMAKITMMGQTQENSATGTWKLEGDKLSMTTKDKDGKEETKTVTFKDGSFTVSEEKGGQKMDLVFKKQ